VVDDEFAVGRMVGRMLERAGWSVETYTSPLDALERLQNDPEAFDMALFDVMMPELSGPELLEAVRGRGISLPVVFMTGSAPANTQTMDARAILSKPFSKHQLLQVLQLDSASS
jgi:CheY-like chemotaxis protein